MSLAGSMAPRSDGEAERVKATIRGPRPTERSRGSRNTAMAVGGSVSWGTLVRKVILATLPLQLGNQRDTRRNGLVALPNKKLRNSQTLTSRVRYREGHPTRTTWPAACPELASMNSRSAWIWCRAPDLCQTSEPFLLHIYSLAHQKYWKSMVIIKLWIKDHSTEILASKGRLAFAIPTSVFSTLLIRLVRWQVLLDELLCACVVTRFLSIRSGETVLWV